MKPTEFEKYIRATADYVLTECYRRLGDMPKAENAFMEVYSQICVSQFSYKQSIKNEFIEQIIDAVCSATKGEMI